MADTFITKLTEVATPTKDDLAIVLDNPTSTPSNKKVTLQNLANNISRFVNTITTNEDDTDIVFKQYDATEVARIHDGETNSATSSGTGASTLQGTASKGGFGFRRPVYTVTAGADDEVIELTLQHSGALIKVHGAEHDLDIKLPAVPLGCEGFHLDFVICTSFVGSNDLEIITNGTTGDNIYLYINHNGTSAADVSGGDVLRTVNTIAVGTLIRLTCAQGGDAELWIAEMMTPTSSGASVETATS